MYLLTLGLVARLGRPEIAYVVTPIVFVIIGSLTGFMVIPSQTPPFYRALQDAIFLRCVRFCLKGFVVLCLG